MTHNSTPTDMCTGRGGRSGRGGRLDADAGAGPGGDATLATFLIRVDASNSAATPPIDVRFAVVEVG